ncbi:MAG: efflux RND transporter periplasmic adaptor subunit [Planctomycetes bacterium]|nr:efflux RND transporter periplasmic adaptor subunit [Planctomycetota bacterium]
MKTIKRIAAILIMLAIIGALVIGGVALIKRKKRELAKAPVYGMRATPVRVAKARQGELVEKTDYLSVVEPIRVANISARLTAAVEKVLHDEGDRVKAGETLVLLDGRDIRENIAAVRAQVEQSQADLASNQATAASLEHSLSYWSREAQRDKTLADKGDIPAAEAEGTADKANVAQGKLRAAKQKSTAIAHLIQSLKRKAAELETKLGYCTITSPYKGLVTQRLVDPGDLATPGKTLMVVEDRSQLKLSFDVPQQDLPRVREGLDVAFRVGGAEREAKLSHMYPSLSATRMLKAEVYLSGATAEGLACGAYVPLSTITGRRQSVVLIPASCLVESPKGKPYVFVVKDEHLDARQVKRLGSHGDETAVAGVKPGEEVVRNTFLGWALLSSGEKVEVIR